MHVCGFCLWLLLGKKRKLFTSARLAGLRKGWHKRWWWVIWKDVDPNYAFTKTCTPGRFFFCLLRELCGYRLMDRSLCHRAQKCLERVWLRKDWERVGQSKDRGKAEHSKHAAMNHNREDEERPRSPGSGAPTFPSVLMKIKQIKHYGHFKKEYHWSIKWVERVRAIFQILVYWYWLSAFQGFLLSLRANNCKSL